MDNYPWSLIQTSDAENGRCHNVLSEVFISVLGPVRVFIDGRPADLPPKSIQLLAALAARRGAYVSSDELATWLWDGETSPVLATKMAQGHVFRARKALTADSILSNGRYYAINLDRVHLDVVSLEYHFRQVLQEFEQLLFVNCLKSADEGLTLWRGCPYETVSEALIPAGETQRLFEVRSRLLEIRTQSLFGLNRFSETIEGLEMAVADNPLREQHWVHLMTALHETGRSADALAAFARARRALAEALGLAPGPLLQRVELQVLRGQPIRY
jgi:DNA-binding SARP family transcriptional activator